MDFNSDSLGYLNFNEEEMHMLKIKAALYSNGDIKGYIKGLLLNDNRPVPDINTYCISCRGVKQMNSITQDEEFILTDKKIVVQSVPKHICISCGSVLSNIKLSAAIEEALESKTQGNASSAAISFKTLVS